MDGQQVRDIISKHSEPWGDVISILEEIQGTFGYLPQDALRMVSEAKSVPLVDIYSVATFYRAFSLQPRGRHLVSACLGTACYVRGGSTIARELETRLGARPGETTADREFTLETVNCLGACALGPVVVVDGRYCSKVRKSRVQQIIAEARKSPDTAELEQDYHIFPVEVSCPRCNHSLMDSSYAIDGYPSMRVTVVFGDKHGWLRLSSVYGSHRVFPEYKIPHDAVPQFFCPHCHAQLIGAGPCATCNAPMVPMIVRGGGIVQICSRQGCKNHMLDLV
ncbi:MAG: NADH-quinone oxidoreductase subunit NuoE family protein [Planctomycetota bacterium]|jgi:NADH-quinone oxidoreductase subunit E